MSTVNVQRNAMVNTGTIDHSYYLPDGKREELIEFTQTSAEQFDYQHSRNYVRFRLKGTSRARAQRQAPRLVKDRKGNGSHRNRIDESVVDDIVQEAFIFWYRAQVGKDGKPARPITTALASFLAVSRYWRNRNAIAEQSEGNSKGHRTAIASLQHDKLTRRTIRVTVLDSLPFVRSKREEQIAKALIALSTGSTQQDVAEQLECSQPYVAKLIRLYREHYHQNET